MLQEGEKRKITDNEGNQLPVSATWHKFHQQFMCGFSCEAQFFVRITKKPFRKAFLYKISTKFLLFAKKSFEEFASSFALFAIRFSSKFDEIDTW